MKNKTKIQYLIARALLLIFSLVWYADIMMHVANPGQLGWIVDDTGLVVIFNILVFMLLGVAWIHLKSAEKIFVQADKLGVQLIDSIERMRLTNPTAPLIFFILGLAIIGKPYLELL